MSKLPPPPTPPPQNLNPFINMEAKPGLPEETLILETAPEPPPTATIMQLLTDVFRQIFVFLQNFITLLINIVNIQKWQENLIETFVNKPKKGHPHYEIPEPFNRDPATAHRWFNKVFFYFVSMDIHDDLQCIMFCLSMIKGGKNNIVENWAEIQQVKLIWDNDDCIMTWDS